MNDKTSFPQIPGTVWWGVRNILKRSPNVTIDERTLGVELDVQETAARQYLTELKRVGILSDESKATPVAQRWRHDDTYGKAVDEILKGAYPDGLTQIAPRGTADRQKIISWFTREGLGSGTAGNKAATYLLISSESPNEVPARGGTSPQKATPRQDGSTKRVSAQPSRAATKANQAPLASATPGPIPLNVNRAGFENLDGRLSGFSA